MKATGRTHLHLSALNIAIFTLSVNEYYFLSKFPNFSPDCPQFGADSTCSGTLFRALRSKCSILARSPTRLASLPVLNIHSRFSTAPSQSMLKSLDLNLRPLFPI